MLPAHQLDFPGVSNAARSTVINKNRDNPCSCFFTSPVTLPLGHNGDPGDWSDSRLNHSLDCHFVRFFGSSTASISDNKDVISFASSLNRRHGNTYFCPKARNNKLLATALLDEIS